MTATIKRDFPYIQNKDYFVVGPRSAWDTVPVGLFESKDSAHGAFPCSDASIIRKATKQEIIDFFWSCITPTP